MNDSLYLQAAVKPILGETGKLRAVFDALGGGPVTDALGKLLAPRGVLFVYGVLVGDEPRISAGDLIFSGTRVQGWWLGHFAQEHGELIGPIIGEFVGYLAKKQISFPYKNFPLKDFQQALFATKHGSKLGKTILTME